MQAGLAGGFADRARESAVAFRAALDVLARPGQVRGVTGVEPPGGLSVAAAALLLTLADAETPLWLPERLRAGAVAEWLRFHTNAPQGTGRGQAMFAVGRWEELAPLAQAAEQARETLAAKAAATRVEFFTVARERA